MCSLLLVSQGVVSAQEGTPAVSSSVTTSPESSATTLPTAPTVPPAPTLPAVDPQTTKPVTVEPGSAVSPGGAGRRELLPSAPFIPPGTVTATRVQDVAVQVPVGGGSPTAATTTNATGQARLRVLLTAGQRVLLRVAFPSNASSISLASPTNANFPVSWEQVSDVAGVRTYAGVVQPVVPGAYVVVLGFASGQTGTASLQVLAVANDTNVAATVGGAQVGGSNPVGAALRYTIPLAAGQRVMLKSTMPSAYGGFTILGPNGVSYTGLSQNWEQVSDIAGVKTLVRVIQPAVPGTYQMIVDPAEVQTAATTLQVLAVANDTNVAATVGGAQVGGSNPVGAALRTRSRSRQGSASCSNQHCLPRTVVSPFSDRTE